MRATGAATEESERNESQFAAPALQMVWYPSASREDRIMVARTHSHCAVPKSFTKHVIMEVMSLQNHVCEAWRMSLSLCECEQRDVKY